MSQYFVDRIFFFLALEWRLRSQQDMHDDPTAPKIALISEKPLDDLRRHVAHRPNQITTLDLAFSHPIRSPKIQQFDLDLIHSRPLQFIDKHNIFQFDIAMDYSQRV